MLPIIVENYQYLRHLEMYFLKLIFCISALLIAPIIAQGNEKQQIVLDPEILLKI